MKKGLNMSGSPYESIEDVVKKTIKSFEKDVGLLEKEQKPTAVSEEDITYENFDRDRCSYFRMMGQFESSLKTYFKTTNKNAPEGTELADEGKKLFVGKILPMYFPLEEDDLGKVSEERFKEDEKLREQAKQIITAVKKARKLNLIHYFGNVKNKKIDELFSNGEHDDLTKLLDNKPFRERLAEETGRIDRIDGIEKVYGKHSIIYLDLDDFKRINDEYGHTFGDEALKISASLIRDYTRPYDLKGRVGGEEMVIYLPNTPIEEAAKKAEELRKALMISGTSNLKAQKRDFGRLSGSFGVSTLREGHNSLLDVMEEAENAMYLVKSGNKNGVEIFNPLKTEEYSSARKNYNGRSDKHEQPEA